MSLKRVRYYSSPPAPLGILNSRFERSLARIQAQRVINGSIFPEVQRYESYYRDLVSEKVCQHKSANYNVSLYN